MQSTFKVPTSLLIFILLIILIIIIFIYFNFYLFAKACLFNDDNVTLSKSIIFKCLTPDLAKFATTWLPTPPTPKIITLEFCNYSNLYYPKN